MHFIKCAQSEKYISLAWRPLSIFIFFTFFFPVNCQGGTGAYPNMDWMEGRETTWTGCHSLSQIALFFDVREESCMKT